jgi:hypothetical protein
VTFEIDSALLEAARGLKIDLNEFVVRAMRDAVAQKGSAAPRDDVMALYQEGEHKFDELYKRLAK